MTYSYILLLGDVVAVIMTGANGKVKWHSIKSDWFRVSARLCEVHVVIQ